MPQNAIETTNLVKRFGEFTAVDGINLKIRRGELFGFLGPNGAGKTTTIRMLTTLTSPTSGKAVVAGFDVADEPSEVRAKIGVVPQAFSLFEELTPLENLWYIGKLNGMKDSEIRPRSEELLKTVTLFDKRDVKTGGFSGGMKQRMSVAAGLLHEPEILFMDEPTTGLDPQSRIALRDLTGELNKDHGITIVYTTHDMEEADKLCHRIAIMDHGSIIALGSSSELKQEVSESGIIDVNAPGVPDGVVKKLKTVPSVRSVERVGDNLLIRTAKMKDAFCDLPAFFRDQKQEILGIRQQNVSLEDVFIKLTSRKLRD